MKQFIEGYGIPRYVALNRETLLEGFRLAKELNHDVSDCMYLALAQQEKS